MAHAKKILLTAFGSHGDLNPMIAIAQQLRALGAQATVGASLAYRDKVESSGIRFTALSPDMPDFALEPDLAKALLDPKTGMRSLVEFVMERLGDSWRDTLAAASGMDALVGSALSMATPMAACKLGIPWASAVFQPMAYLSAIDAPTLIQAPWLDATRAWGSAGIALRRAAFFAGGLSTRRWCLPHRDLRRELGLPPEPEPLLAAARSPWLSLALFSPALGPIQSDWPSSAVQTGFPLIDEAAALGESMPGDLLDFLCQGPPPVVFTLGTAAVHWANGFYEAGRAACSRLGVRAVFLTGAPSQNAMAGLPRSMIAVPYAPHDLLFPQARAIVHSCGVGTCSASMRSGVPVLAAPWAHDQPDNARRLRALGVASILPRSLFNAERAEAALGALLSDSSIANRASLLGASERRLDNGALVAAKAILSKLG